MQRWDIINYFIKKYNYKSYLEIGYYKGWSFDRINFIPLKTAVDPNPCKTPEQEQWETSSTKWHDIQGGDSTSHVLYKTTSDEFFKNLGEWMRFDIIFIDGLHERKQVLKDLKNSFNHLSDNGIIIMHDCNPPKYEHTTTGIDGCWTGDVYKAMLDLRLSHEANAFVIDTDWGVGIVKPRIKVDGERPITESEHFNAIFNWAYFDEHRKHLLGLQSISKFLSTEEVYNDKTIEDYLSSTK